MLHIVSATDLSTEQVLRVFKRAKYYSDAGRESYRTLGGKIVAIAFEESSTRTWSSFIGATLRLDGNVLPIPDAAKFSSFSKGETLEDTVRILSANCDLIVMRHRKDGDAALAARAALVPYVNAGDGANEHPTQALLDLFTIWELVQSGRLPRESLHILSFGDNEKSRTVRSLAYLLATHAERIGIAFGTMAFCGANGDGTPPQDIMDMLGRHGYVTPTHALDAELRCAEVVYLTRTQRERRESGAHGERPFVFTKEHASMMPPRGIIMHPLPRAGELSPEVDSDPRAWYFKQASNGLYVRMALLELLLGVI